MCRHRPSTAHHRWRIRSGCWCSAHAAKRSRAGCRWDAGPVRGPRTGSGARCTCCGDARRRIRALAAPAGGRRTRSGVDTPGPGPQRPPWWVQHASRATPAPGAFRRRHRQHRTPSRDEHLRRTRPRRATAVTPEGDASAPPHDPAQRQPRGRLPVCDNRGPAIPGRVAADQAGRGSAPFGRRFSAERAAPRAGPGSRVRRAAFSAARSRPPAS